MAPTNPKRLQVADRFVTVLEDIRAGSNYFYTPTQVVRRHISDREAQSASPNPVYMVFTMGGEGGSIVISGVPDGYDETFFIVIKGIIHNYSDPVQAVELCVRDVRKAINDDSKTGTSGALGDGSLTVQVRIDTPPEMEYYDDFGVFFQEFRIQIEGDFGEL